MTFFNKHDLTHCVAWTLYHLFEKQIIYYLAEEVFWLACESFSEIIYVLVLFLLIIGQLVIWHFDYFFFLFQIIDHHHQQQGLQLNFVSFWIISRLFFYGVTRFHMYIGSGSTQHRVSGWWVKCHVNVFIICVVTNWNWNRDCKNISSNIRSLSVMFANLSNLANSIGHNDVRFFPCVEIMWFGWYFRKYYLIQWKIW